MKKPQNNQSDLPAAVAATVAEQGLLRHVRRLGLAVSGGADSVALAHLLLPLCRQRGIHVWLLHLNHALRGRDSDGDARAVRRLAGTYDCPCAIVRVSALKLPEARPATRSLEMWARAARLAFFRRCTGEFRLDAVATAHHADDVAETLLLRLARGAGISGLAGLKPRTVLKAAQDESLTLIRPLLGFDRNALRAWLRREGYRWREDASNRDTRIPRNALRQVVIPWLEKQWQPALRRQLARSAEILRAEDDYLQTAAEHALREVVGARGAPLRGRLARLPLALQRRVVRLWLMRQGATGDAAGFDAVSRA